MRRGGGRRLVFHRVAYNSCMFQKVNTKSHGHLTACSRIYNKCAVFTPKFYAFSKSTRNCFRQKTIEKFQKIFLFQFVHSFIILVLCSAPRSQLLRHIGLAGPSSYNTVFFQLIFQIITFVRQFEFVNQAVCIAYKFLKIPSVSNFCLKYTGQWAHLRRVH